MPVFWYAQKKKQRRKILLSCTAFHHLLCMKFVHKIKGTWWSMLISVKQEILIHIIEAWWHGVYVEQVGSQISQWIKKTPKNINFSGFVVFSFVSSLDRKIIACWTESPVKQGFFSVLCATSVLRKNILYYSAKAFLFSFRWFRTLFDHPCMFILYPHPSICFKSSLSVRIVLWYNTYVVQPIPDNGRRWTAWIL